MHEAFPLPTQKSEGPKVIIGVNKLIVQPEGYASAPANPDNQNAPKECVENMDSTPLGLNK